MIEKPSCIIIAAKFCERFLLENISESFKSSSNIKHISKGATNVEICEYLNYLADRLTYILENLDEENMTDSYNRKGGKYGD